MCVTATTNASVYIFVTLAYVLLLPIRMADYKNKISNKTSMSLSLVLYTHIPFSFNDAESL